METLGLFFIFERRRLIIRTNCVGCLHNNGKGNKDLNNVDCLTCSDYNNFKDLWYATESERDERNARLGRNIPKKSITMQLREDDIDKLTLISNRLCLSDSATIHFLIDFYETWRFEDFNENRNT